jgi:hypothetical protein
MGKYVLFGAGMTGTAAVNYFGKENIVAIIDNNPNKVGTIFEGIEVISFDTYLNKYMDLQIIISLYSSHYYEVLKQLKNNGVKNYFTAPPVLYGFDTPEEMVDIMHLEQYSKVAFYGCNPITTRMVSYIKENKTDITVLGYIRDSHIDERETSFDNTPIYEIQNLSNDVVLVLADNEAEASVRERLKEIWNGKLLDIYEIHNGQRKYFREGLLQYKNKYQAKRCFVIGNGPSLKKQDLQMLKDNDEITFAANGIYHIYGETEWRPDFYVICDFVAYKTMLESGAEYVPSKCFIPDYYYANCKILKDINHFHFINRIYCKNDELKFSEDIVRGIYSGRTVTYVMLQIACYMGFKEIYLIGVDWTGGKGTGKPRVDFYNKDNVGTQPYDCFYEEEKSFLKAREYAEEHGIRIYNATRGGELEVFERVNLDEVLSIC